MRELSNIEIDTVSGAGLKVGGKCYVFDSDSAAQYFIGSVVGTIVSIWGSGGSPDPWG